MMNKYTAILTQAPASLSQVPAGNIAIIFDNATTAVQEFGPGRLLPVRSVTQVAYLIPMETFEGVFAVADAITCAKPDGTPFYPGMCLKLRFSYVSALGIKKLLATYKQTNGRVPECVTLEMLYNTLAKDLKATCAQAAAAFSHQQVLPYSHWWNDIRYDGGYCKQLFTPMMQLFTSYGLRLDPEAFAIPALAQMPVA